MYGSCFGSSLLCLSTSISQLVRLEQLRSDPIDGVTLKIVKREKIRLAVQFLLEGRCSLNKMC